MFTLKKDKCRDYDINYFITDHLGSTRAIVNANNGEIKYQKDSYHFFGQRGLYMSEP
jgi:hypothetical protein